MTTLEIKLELPEGLAKEARQAGLLAPEAIEKLIAEALRRRAFDELLSVADRVEAAGVPPMNGRDQRRDQGLPRGAPARRASPRARDTLYVSPRLLAELADVLGREKLAIA